MRCLSRICDGCLAVIFWLTSTIELAQYLAHASQIWSTYEDLRSNGAESLGEDAAKKLKRLASKDEVLMETFDQSLFEDHEELSELYNKRREHLKQERARLMELRNEAVGLRQVRRYHHHSCSSVPFTSIVVLLVVSSPCWFSAKRPVPERGSSDVDNWRSLRCLAERKMAAKASRRWCNISRKSCRPTMQRR